jgi:hypothetical protein
VPPYTINATKSGKSANRPPQGKPRTNLAAALKGQTLVSWHSATAHATTDAAAPMSRNAVQTFIMTSYRL